MIVMIVCSFFFFKQKTAYEMLRSLVGSEMCIRDSPITASSLCRTDLCCILPTSSALSLPATSLLLGFLPLSYFLFSLMKRTSSWPEYLARIGSTLSSMAGLCRV
eukprot:TRINITY_DN15963_c0_g2_i4.p2 TRINITY_DN15963_c0_g2~~TRINITY_DN15963_c0_g2_i4.p2  ORF type:complete len:105 (+),score=31.12 TRINITY_DN15963_c0_g2_i4:65-379(+)